MCPGERQGLPNCGTVSSLALRGEDADEDGCAQGSTSAVAVWSSWSSGRAVVAHDADDNNGVRLSAEVLLLCSESPALGRGSRLRLRPVGVPLALLVPPLSVLRRSSSAFMASTGSNVSSSMDRRSMLGELCRPPPDLSPVASNGINQGFSRSFATSS